MSIRDVRISTQRRKVRKQDAGSRAESLQLKASGKYQIVWETVNKIPRGHVSSYGAIATEAGLAGHARLVGYALHNLPDGFDVPWHRVINARGKISFRKGSRIHRLQRKLLEQEGVRFVADRVPMNIYGWP